MAGGRAHNLDKRLHGLASENVGLERDVDDMRDVLTYHYEGKGLDADCAVKGLLRKEIGGSIWQHGAEGKVTKYKSSRDLESQYGLKSEKKNSSLDPDERAMTSKPAKTKPKVVSHSNVSSKSLTTRSTTSTGTVQGKRVQSGKLRKPVKSAQRDRESKSKQGVPSLSIKGLAGSPDEPPCIDEAFIIESVSMANNKGLQYEEEANAEQGVESSVTTKGSSVTGNFGTKSDDLKATEKRKKALEKMMKKLNYGDDLEAYRVPESCNGQEAGKKISTQKMMISQEPCDPSVKRWLRSLHLMETDMYVNLFAQHGINMSAVPELTKDRLRQMGIKNIGVQNKIMSAVTSLAQRKLVRTPTSPVKTHSVPIADIPSPVEDTIPMTVLVEPSQIHSQKQAKESSTPAAASQRFSKGASSSTGAKSKPSGSARVQPVTSPQKGRQVSSARRPASLPTRPVSAKEAANKKAVNPRSRPFSASTALGGDRNQDRSTGKQALSVTSPSGRNKQASPRMMEQVEVSSGGSSSRSGQGSARGQRSPGRSPRMAFPSPKDNLEDLLNVKTLHQQVAIHESPNVANETADYYADDETSHELLDITQHQQASDSSESRSDIAEQKLLEVEMQVQSLQENLSNPAALKMIHNLQLQLKAVQSEIVKEKKKAKKTDTPNRPDADHPRLAEDEHEPLANQVAVVADSLSNQIGEDSEDAAVSTNQIEASNEGEPEGTNLLPPKIQPRHLPAHKTPAVVGRMPTVRASIAGFGHSVSPQKPGGGVVSMSMSKSELLREVRKQKDQHRKEIRHLESELSRLKHKDPLRTFEIPEKDIIFQESDLLGEGAFSQVFHGFYQGSEVAVKRLKVPLSSQDKNYFTAEVSLLQGLRHPHVVLLLGVCTSSHLPVMVLEFMAQGSLYHYLHHPDRPTLDHAEFYQIARDIALGMNYLHLHRPPVLHLDLKSMNVLLTTHLHAKIADFGFSKLRHDADMASEKEQGQGHTKGTPAWMAPELLGGGNVSTKCDVYSFAIVLWEMMTGRQPYEGCTVFQVLERVRQQRRPEIDPESCPSELQQLVTRCWEQNPSKRPHFKDILKSLDELHFPTEWRSLFDAAGIPPSALNNIESTRTLINIVTQNIESAEDERDMDIFPNTDQSLSNFLSVDESLSGQMPTIPRLRLCSSGSEDEHRLSASGKGSSKHAPTFSKSTKSSGQPMQISLAWSEDLSGASSDRTAHPSVPPLRMSLLDDSKPPEEPDPELLKPISFLEELKKGAENLKPKLVSSENEPKLKEKEPQKAAAAVRVSEIRASQLVRQKQCLRSTFQPHPNQLKDLKEVTPDQIDSLAALLRKAVNDRRLSMQAQEDQSTDDIHLTNDSGWSVTQD